MQLRDFAGLQNEGLSFLMKFVQLMNHLRKPQEIGRRVTIIELVSFNLP